MVSVNFLVRVTLIVVTAFGAILITPSTTKKLFADFIAGGSYGFTQPVSRSKARKKKICG